MVQDALSMALFIVLLALIDEFSAAGEHGLVS